MGNNDNVHVAVADVGRKELCVCIAYVAFMRMREVCVWILVPRTPEMRVERNKWVDMDVDEIGDCSVPYYAQYLYRELVLCDTINTYFAPHKI